MVEYTIDGDLVLSFEMNSDYDIFSVDNSIYGIYVSERVKEIIENNGLVSNLQYKK